MREEVFESVCEFQWMATPLFVIDLTLLALLLVVFPFIERGSATYYVALLSIGIIGGTLLVWGGLKYECRRFERKTDGFLERGSDGE